MQVKKSSFSNFRSTCPISSALDLIGDKWTLLIIRDLMFMGKQTFKDFSASEEAIATNILSDRLAKLEEHGIISKNKNPENNKVNIYALTQKGIDFMPLLAEYILWSDKYLSHHIAKEAGQFAKTLKKDKMTLLRSMQKQLKNNIK